MASVVAISVSSIAAGPSKPEHWGVITRNTIGSAVADLRSGPYGSFGVTGPATLVTATPRGRCKPNHREVSPPSGSGAASDRVASPRKNVSKTSVYLWRSAARKSS